MNEFAPKKPKLKAKERRAAAKEAANKKFRHETNCGGKVGYDSKRAANEQRVKIKQLSGRNFDLYLCTECGKFHFGGGKK